MDAAEADIRAHFLDAEAEHASGSESGVFGTPSLVYPDNDVAFVKLDTLPTAERARALAEDSAELREWQRLDPAPGAAR